MRLPLQSVVEDEPMRLTLAMVPTPLPCQLRAGRCYPDRGVSCSQTLYTEVASNTLGPNMTKALYRGYTDATFETLADVPAQHGLLGPFIVAEVRSTPAQLETGP